MATKCQSLSVLTTQYRRTTISAASTTKEYSLFDSENPLMILNYLFHVKWMLSVRWHNSSERVVPIFVDYE